MRSRSLVARGIGLALTLSALSAHAAFTTEEQASVRKLYGDAKPGSASKMRSQLARADHADEDVRGLAIASMRAVPFDEAHRAFAHEVLSGTGSEPSRSTLAPALVAGALA